MKLFEKRQERLKIFHRKKIKKHSVKEIPEYVFETCPNCHASIPYKDLIEDKYVCFECGHHFKISAYERIRQVCDADSFKEIDKSYVTKNVDKFEGYDKKLSLSQQKTGLKEAVVCGIGKTHSLPCAIGVMDSHFMMGSMGVIVGEKISRLIRLARKKKLPLLLFCTSGGARMQEGIQSLVQMAKTSAELKQFSNEKGL